MLHGDLYYSLQGFVSNILSFIFDLVSDFRRPYNIPIIARNKNTKHDSRKKYETGFIFSNLN